VPFTDPCQARFPEEQSNSGHGRASRSHKGYGFGEHER